MTERKMSEPYVIGSSILNARLRSSNMRISTGDVEWVGKLYQNASRVRSTVLSSLPPTATRPPAHSPLTPDPVPNPVPSTWRELTITTTMSVLTLSPGFYKISNRESVSNGSDILVKLNPYVNSSPLIVNAASCVYVFVAHSGIFSLVGGA